MKEDVVETTTIEPDAWPDLTARDAKVYTDQQIPYPNHADNQTLAQRALTLYRQAKLRSEEDTDDIRENWRWIDWLFRANSLRRLTNQDVHVPELLKMHRALVPRLVEAFFGNGREWFVVRGRDRSDRQREGALTALLEMQLEQNNFRSMMAPFASSLAKYQVAVWKVTWEVKTRKQVYHWVEPELRDGELVEVHKRTVKDVAYFAGNKIRLVDPARFIVDAERWDLDELSYVGDTRDESLHEIESNPRYMNVDELRSLVHQGNSTEMKVTPQQSARSGLRRHDRGDRRLQPRGTSEFVEIGELWCWFNWSSDPSEPDMRQTVITVADNNVVLRLQENFHDDKHIPYAISRFSDNGLEFFGVGLYDPALRVQEEIDHTRGSVYEAFDLINAPRGFAKGTNLDLPNSMYDMPPGWIGKGVDGITFAPIPSTLRDAPFIDALQRRDMEEVTGVTRTWVGTNGGGIDQDETATAFRGKMQESNRRLLGLVRNLDEGMTALLRIMHANNQQFMVEKQRVRLLNPKWAELLNASETFVHPSDLMGDVDFQFYGVMRIQQYGLRGTNLLTFLQVMGPIIQENPHQFDIAALSRQVYRATVGEEIEDDFVIDSANLDGMQGQEIENKKLLYGQRVAVHPHDNDEDHIAKMDRIGGRRIVEDESQPDPRRKAFADHYRQHVEQLSRKRAQRQAMEEMAEQRQLQRGENSGNGDAAQAPPAGGLERGRRQTNGDGTPEQTPRPGRNAAVAQSDNG